MISLIFDWVYCWYQTGSGNEYQISAESLMMMMMIIILKSHHLFPALCSEHEWCHGRAAEVIHGSGRERALHRRGGFRVHARVHRLRFTRHSSVSRLAGGSTGQTRHSTMFLYLNLHPFCRLVSVRWTLMIPVVFFPEPRDGVCSGETELQPAGGEDHHLQTLHRQQPSERRCEGEEKSDLNVWYQIQSSVQQTKAPQLVFSERTSMNRKPEERAPLQERPVMCFLRMWEYRAHTDHRGVQEEKRVHA